MIEKMIQHEIDAFQNHSHMQKYVLKNGKKYIAKNGKSLGKPKQCYMNSIHEAIRNDFLYVEGYILLENIPLLIQHAWCVEKNSDIVIETTMKDVEKCEYFGVEFDVDIAMEMMIVHGNYGIFDTGYGLNMKVLK